MAWRLEGAAARARAAAGRGTISHSGCALDHVVGGQRQAEVGGQQDVDPRVNAEAPGARPLDQVPEGVEAGRLRKDERAPSHEPGFVERVAASPHLDEEVGEAAFGGPVHRAVHGLGGHERGAHDPEASDLGRVGRRQGRRGREQQQRQELHRPLES